MKSIVYSFVAAFVLMTIFLSGSTFLHLFGVLYIWVISIILFGLVGAMILLMKIANLSSEDALSDELVAKIKSLEAYGIRYILFGLSIFIAYLAFQVGYEMTAVVYVGTQVLSQLTIAWFKTASVFKDKT